jgi:enoyl-CoA hydratase/carnithine racemase
MPDYQTILYETTPSDGVATITLNRPDRLNAFNHAMGHEFAAVWERVKEDKAVRAVVLRAAGDRAFSTGADVKDGGWSRASNGPFGQDDPGEWLGPKQRKCWKPVVCAVQGMCAGGAYYWINESDIVICSEDATFFDPHTSFGLVCAVEPVGLRARMPYSEIMRMILMGNDERITAQTALRISLVTEVTTRASLWNRAHEIAAGVAKKPGVTTQGTVRAMWESLDLPYSAAVANAFKYTQLGNPIGTAEVDRWKQPKAAWKAR